MDLQRSLNKIWGIRWGPIKPPKLMNFTDQRGGGLSPQSTPEYAYGFNKTSLQQLLQVR